MQPMPQQQSNALASAMSTHYALVTIAADSSYPK